MRQSNNCKDSVKLCIKTAWSYKRITYLDGIVSRDRNFQKAADGYILYIAAQCVPTIIFQPAPPPHTRLLTSSVPDPIMIRILLFLSVAFYQDANKKKVLFRNFFAYYISTVGAFTTVFKDNESLSHKTIRNQGIS